jgi:hypothetical protein
MHVSAHGSLGSQVWSQGVVHMGSRQPLMVTRTRETWVPVYRNGLRLPSMGRLGGRLSNHVAGFQPQGGRLLEP